MQTTLFINLACAILIATGLSGTAAGQQSTSDRGSRPDLDEIRKVSTLIKTEVLNRANEKIAGVSDLILTPEGRIEYAILSVGGIVGIGARYTAIPWSKLEVKHPHDKWAVNLDMTKDRLQQAPMLQDEHYKELTNPQWIARIHEFFGGQGTGTGTTEAAGEKSSAHAQQKVLRASKILGATLKSPRDETLGDVKDLLLDRNDRVAFAVIGHGGVLGIGENYIPVPWTKLRLTYRPEDTSVAAVIDVSKDQLERAPLVKGSTYETMLAPGFTAQVYRYFGIGGRE